MKRKIAFILAGIMMLFCMGVPLLASDGAYGLYRWDNTSCIIGGITFDGTSGNYSMMVQGASGVNKITATATLYYKNSSGRWVVIPTNWSYEVSGNLLLIDEDFTGVSGREYKVELEATVYKDGYGEPVSKTSTKTCP